MSSDTDPHQGGRLEDMAEKGTTMPSDAGTQRVIRSVPRPDQVEPDDKTTSNLVKTADNPIDIPRSYRDTGMTGEVMTGTGDQLPATTVEHKNLAGGGDEAVAKGHSRTAKHVKQNETLEDKLASAGHEVEEAPGEERVEQDELRSRREGGSLR